MTHVFHACAVLLAAAMCVTCTHSRAVPATLTPQRGTPVAMTAQHASPVLVAPQPAGANGPRELEDYSHRIDRDATWRALSASPGFAMVAHTEVVKVLIDLEDDSNVWFLQSTRWPIHYFFALRFLSRPGHFVGDQASYNHREYLRQDRRFINGLLVHYRDQGRWTFEIDSGDTLDIPRTVQAFNTVRALVFFGDRLNYRPVPAQHEAGIEQFRAAHVALVTTQDIFGATRFQPLNVGESYGVLRFASGEPDRARIRRTDIVVLESVPLDLPVCAGIITNQLQAPLGHVAVLAANRGTPNMALRGASGEASLRALEGHMVRMHVTAQDWSVSAATQREAEASWDARRPSVASRPPLSLRNVGMPDIATLAYADLATIGAKAAQLAELGHVARAEASARTHAAIRIPRAFSLPFFYYRQHLSRNRLDAAFTTMLARPEFQNDPLVRDQALREFRDRIEHAPLARPLIPAIRARITRLFPGTRVRFRSSTNAEDLPGFNGAGLYRSTLASATASDREISDAIRQVWASAWSAPGFEERAYFRIDQSRVAMAILVQESIDDDVVNGVAITANPFDQDRPGIYINAQVAGAEGGAVTSARGDDVPEQVMLYTYLGDRDFERLSRSSRAHGGVVLRDDEVVALGHSLGSIAAHFSALYWWGGQAVDVEFIIAGTDRHLVIVQARPYTVRWEERR